MRVRKIRDIFGKDTVSTIKLILPEKKSEKKNEHKVQDMQIPLPKEKEVENQNVDYFNNNEHAKRGLFKFEYKPKYKKLALYIYEHGVLIGMSFALQSYLGFHQNSS